MGNRTGPPSSSITAIEFHIHVASIVNHRRKSSIADQRRKTRVAGAVATGLSLLPLTSLKEVTVVRLSSLWSMAAVAVVCGWLGARAGIGGVVELFSGGVSGSDGGEIGSQWLANTTVK
nr:hypothetical protein Iba_chr01cCG3570 [Ipomoea batatas]